MCDVYYVYDNNDVNDIAEYNLPHNILNPSKGAKSKNSHFPPIRHGLINTQRGKAKFKI